LKNLYYKILRLDRKGYGNYKGLKGLYEQSGTEIEIFHVQGDPYANPSKVIYRLPLSSIPGMGKWAQSKEHSIAAADYIFRRLSDLLSGEEEEDRSPLIIPKPTTYIINQKCVQIKGTKIEFRLKVQFPSLQGREIDAQNCARILCEHLPSCCSEAVYLNSVEEQKLTRHVSAYLRQNALRNILDENNWVAFVENGSILARKSHLSDLPLEKAKPFKSPKEQEVELEVLGEKIRGMAIPKGFTLIVGGAYFGKSTLLEAIAHGCYNFPPDDGRSGVVSIESQYLQSEAGRYVRGVDVSPFFRELGGSHPNQFVSDKASGSSAQAASLIEALEVETPLLLLDEDACSVNFLYKDKWMRSLIGSESDPLRPLLEHMAELKKQTSVIMVAGASGEYFPYADLILQADRYQYFDVSEKAHALGVKSQSGSSEFKFKTRKYPAAYWRLIQAEIGRNRKMEFKSQYRLNWTGLPFGCENLYPILSPEQTQVALLALRYAIEYAVQQENWSIQDMFCFLKGKNLLEVSDDGGSCERFDVSALNTVRFFNRTPLPLFLDKN
jgi:predicted ABC-class ATPase